MSDKTKQMLATAQAKVEALPNNEGRAIRYLLQDLQTAGLAAMLGQEARWPKAIAAVRAVEAEGEAGEAKRAALDWADEVALEQGFAPC